MLGALTEPDTDLQLTLALVVCEICPANEVDTVIPIFLNLFDNRASITTLLKAVIEQEIRSTSKPQRFSMPTGLLTLTQLASLRCSEATR